MASARRAAILQTFRKHDDAGDGLIPKSELVHALEIIGSPRADVDAVLAEVEGDELVNYTAFVNSLYMQDSPLTKRDAHPRKAAEARTTTMPEDPQYWGMTIQQIFDFAFEIFPFSRSHLFAVNAELIEAAQNGSDMKEVECQPGYKTLTMYDIVATYVKPKTKDANLSLAVYSNQKKPLKATVFLSHAWAEQFEYFVATLCVSCLTQEMCEEVTREEWEISVAGMEHAWRLMFGFTDGPLPPETIIWVCAFAINQNASIQGVLGGNVLQTPFARVLEASSRVVVLFNPSKDLYTRVWCVMELYLAAKRRQEPTFSLLFVGSLGCGQVPDVAWMQKNFPDEYPDVLELGIKNRVNADMGRTGELIATFPNASIWARRFVAENPRRVRDAEASEEQDRIDIMTLIDPMMRAVDQLMEEMRIERIATAIICTIGNSKEVVSTHKIVRRYESRRGPE